MKLNTKHIIVAGVILVILPGVFWFMVHDGYPIRNIPSSGTNIIAFGDSLIQGIGSTDGNDFVSLLSKQLDVSIINSGRSGDTTEMALMRIKRDVTAHDPKVVLVLLGGNDFLKRVPRDTMIKNLREIITTIQESGGAVLLLGIRGGLITDTYEEELKNLAFDTGAAYIPNVLKGLLGNSKFMDDSIHPNNTGYKVIAERVLPELTKLIR